MSKFRRYKVIGASNYEVNSQGELFKMSPNERSMGKGRKTITFDNGDIRKITPLVEFDRAQHAELQDRSRFTMVPDFPNYEIDRNAMIYNVNRPMTPLGNSGYDGVYIYNQFGRLQRINRFKAYALYVLCQEDVGVIHVEKEYFGIGWNKPCSHMPLSKKRVQLIHPDLRYWNIRLLEHFPGYAAVKMDDCRFSIIDVKTSLLVETRMDHYMNTYYRLPIRKQYKDETGTSYKNDVFVEVSLRNLFRPCSKPFIGSKLKEW